MRTGLLVVGIVAVLIGLVWIGQGTGYFPYPAMSFMIRQVEWAYIGGVLVLLGLLLVWRSRG